MPFFKVAACLQQRKKISPSALGVLVRVVNWGWDNGNMRATDTPMLAASNTKILHYEYNHNNY
jgi:hypothetical protein